jgi:hypothetical protein
MFMRVRWCILDSDHPAVLVLNDEDYQQLRLTLPTGFVLTPSSRMREAIMGVPLVQHPVRRSYLVSHPQGGPAFTYV